MQNQPVNLEEPTYEYLPEDLPEMPVSMIALLRAMLDRLIEHDQEITVLQAKLNRRQ